MLQAAGLTAAAVGNVGTHILDALREPVEHDVLAVELSSFQLHWTSSMSPLASVVLNVAEDYVDWHGGYENYVADKSRIYEHTRVACVYNAQQAETVRMVEEADVEEGCRAVGFTLETPDVSMLGVVEDLLVDRAFLDDRRGSALELASITDTGPLPTPHGVANALAAAALARAAGAPPEAVREGLRAWEPGDHRIQAVATTHGVLWINDSKATNPHAADAALAAFDSVVWIRRPVQGRLLRSARRPARRPAAHRGAHRHGQRLAAGRARRARPRGPRPADRRTSRPRGGRRRDGRGGAARPRGRPEGRHGADGPGVRLDGPVQLLRPPR